MSENKLSEVAMVFKDDNFNHTSIEFWGQIKIDWTKNYNNCIKNVPKLDASMLSNRQKLILDIKKVIHNEIANDVMDIIELKNEIIKIVENNVLTKYVNYSKNILDFVRDYICFEKNVQILDENSESENLLIPPKRKRKRKNVSKSKKRKEFVNNSNKFD